MIPAAFDYEVASSVDDAIRLVGQSDDAKLIAGGHSLLPLMKLRFAQPALLVDIGRLGDLSYVRGNGDGIAIGALTRHHDVSTSPLLRQECAILADAAGQVGDPQVRHRGTIGGSVAHGDPASDLPTVLLALDAELVVKGSGGDRTIPAKDFFTGFLETALGPQDVLTEIRVRKLGGNASTYLKFNRRAQDWATVAVAAVASNGTASVALTNMGPTPLRAAGVEEALASGAGAAQAAEKAADGILMSADLQGSVEYKQHLTRVYTRRALEAAAGRAR